MRHHVLSGSTALLLATPLVLAQEDAEPLEAAAILDRVYAAYGAPAALAGVANRVCEGKSWFAGTENKGSFHETVAGIFEARISSKMPGFGDFEEGAGYGVVWEINPMSGARIKGSDDAQTALRRYGLLAYTPWRDLYAKAELAGVERIAIGADGAETHEVFRLLLTPRPWCADGTTGTVTAAAESEARVDGVAAPSPDTWYVDRETFLPIRLDIEMKNPAGAPIRMELEQTDWRAVDGILYPHEKRVSMMGFTWVQRYESIRHDVELPEDTFHMPAKVRDAMGATLAHDDEPDTTEIRIEEVEERHTATIRVKCTQDEIGATLAVALPEIMIYLTSIGAKVNGPPFTRYHSYSEAEIDLEAGIPVAQPIEPKGRVRPATLPGGHAVSGWHLGPYEELGRTHTAIGAWIEERGIEVTGPAWEIYWTDPGMEPDPKKWRTQLLFPCTAPEAE